MIKVPIAVRMISGRKRIRSVGLNMGLTGTAHLRARGTAEIDPVGYIDLGLFEHVGGGLADWVEERFRVDAHPDHHGDQRNDDYPLAQVEVGHVRPHCLFQLAVENALVHPEHVASGENDSDLTIMAISGTTTTHSRRLRSGMCDLTASFNSP